MLAGAIACDVDVAGPALFGASGTVVCVAMLGGGIGCVLLPCAESPALVIVVGTSTFELGSASFTMTAVTTPSSKNASAIGISDRFGTTCDDADASPLGPGEGPASGEIEPRVEIVPVTA